MVAGGRLTVNRIDECGVLFSCVAEGAAEWVPAVENLVFSLRRFGGRCRSARFVVNFVGEVPANAARVLSDLDVEIRCVEPMPDRGTGNKLRMLDLHESFEFDVLVALDCDTLVVADPLPHIPISAIGAKPVDYDPLSSSDWRRIYRALGITHSASKVHATSSGREIPPCFNSGVLTVPRLLSPRLQQDWSDAHFRVAAAFGSDSHLIPRHLHFFADQVSLAVCLARADLSHVTLPVTMNCPTHVPVHQSSLPVDSEPVILHYHDAVDRQGFLYRPRSSVAVHRADEFNLARASRTGVPYAGLRRRPVLSRFVQASAQRFWLILAIRQRLRSMLGGRFNPVNRKA